ncbi:MAG: hypothetical protein R3E86_12375 [Pseudomonadales bacterium]
MEWHVSNGAYPEFPPGFVIRAEQRFDPLVQRLMAEHELRALPLRDGQLFYVVPAGMDPHQQEVQIRYIEWLLRQQVIEPDSASP